MSTVFDYLLSFSSEEPADERDELDYEPLSVVHERLDLTRHQKFQHLASAFGGTHASGACLWGAALNCVGMRDIACAIVGAGWKDPERVQLFVSTADNPDWRCFRYNQLQEYAANEFDWCGIRFCYGAGLYPDSWCARKAAPGGALELHVWGEDSGLGWTVNLEEGERHRASSWHMTRIGALRDLAAIDVLVSDWAYERLTANPIAESLDSRSTE